MADKGTSSTLVLVAAVFQLILLFVYAGLAGLFAMVIPLLTMIPPSELPPGVTIADLILIAQGMWGLFGYLAIGAVLSLFFTILWFMWRGQPSQHRVGLIITGIIGLILTGFLPGLLALIGGALAKEKSESLPGARPAPATPPAETVKYCAACGNPIDPLGAEFCGVCGAATT
jgi:MFS family permease